MYLNKIYLKLDFFIYIETNTSVPFCELDFKIKHLLLIFGLVSWLLPLESSNTVFVENNFTYMLILLRNFEVVTTSMNCRFLF